MIRFWAVPLLIAHQGGNQERPDATRVSFDHGRDSGADVLELDVHPGLDEYWWPYYSNDDMKKAQVPADQEFPWRGKGLTIMSSIRAAHRQGISVYVRTINDAEEMDWLIAMGVDGIITDRPSLPAEKLSRFGKVPDYVRGNR